MTITADTNVLVRVAVPGLGGDAVQTAQARAVLHAASVIAVTLPTLCEFVWVLDRAYGYGRADIAAAIRRLVAAATVVCDRQAVEAGLSVLEAGGDFADGVIAFDGARLGGATFVSFDRKAVRLLSEAGRAARLVGEA